MTAHSRKSLPLHYASNRQILIFIVQILTLCSCALPSINDTSLFSPSPNPAPAPPAHYPRRYHIPGTFPPIYLAIYEQGKPLLPHIAGAALSKTHQDMDSLILAHGAKSALSAQGLTFSTNGLRITASPVPRAARVFTYGVFRDVLSGLAEMMRLWGYREIRAEVGIVQLVYMRPDGWVKFTQEAVTDGSAVEALASGLGGIEEVAVA